MRARKIVGLLSLAAVLLLAGCAAAPHEVTPTTDGELLFKGFTLGLWHGFIAPVAFVLQLLDVPVSVYQVPNIGNVYDLGVGIGLIGFVVVIAMLLGLLRRSKS